MDKQNSDLYAIKIFTGFIVMVLLVIILKALKNIFIPFFMALLLYFFFNRPVRKLLKLKIPLPLVLISLLVSIFIALYFFGMLIYASVSSFVDRFPEYSGHFTTMITGLLERLEIPIKDLNSYVANINWEQIINPSKVTAIISSTFGDIGGFIGDLLLVLLFLMFMLAGRESMLRRLKKAFIEDRAEKIGNIINSVENQVQSYLLIKTLVNLSVATICGFIMFIGGFDFVIFAALLIFFLSFIPNFGSIVATLFPVLTGFIKFGFSFRLIAVTLGLMVTQFIIGNVFEPKITGKSLDISPIVIMMSLIFWGYVWGIVGMILAVPLTSAMKIIFQNIPTLSPLAEIISSD